MIRAISFVAAIALACRSTPEPAAPMTKTADRPVVSSTVDTGANESAPDRELAAFAARAVALYEEIARVLAADGENCAQASAHLQELVAKYGDVIAANRRIVYEGRAARLKIALRPHEPKLEQAARSIMTGPTMSACANDGAFRRAFDQLIGTTR